MILNVYSLFDVKAGFFGLPFYCQSHGEAIRICIEAAQDMRSTIARYPSDFILHLIGQYDNQNAQLTSAMPDPIGMVSAMLPRQEKLPLEMAQALTHNLNGAGEHV